MSTNDPTTTPDAVAMLSRATMRVSKSLANDQSTVAGSITASGVIVANAIEDAFVSDQPGQVNVADALGSIAKAIHRLADVIEKAQS